MSANPYAPSAAALLPDEPLGDEALRHQYLKHEASVRSIGLLYFLGTALLVAVGLFTLISAFVSAAEPTERVLLMAGSLLYLAIGTLQGFVGRGIRRLRPWAKYIAVAFSVFGLLAFPVGTLINGYILYLLLSQKGAVVFSDDYRRAVAATPHIKYRSSFGRLLLLALLITFLIVALLAMFVAAV